MRNTSTMSLGQLTVSALGALLWLSSHAATAADVYRCPGKDGQQVFQDHPCDGSAAAIAAPAPSHTQQEQQIARHDCEEWSQMGYLAAVARDANQAQQQVLERYGRDGLSDGERAAIDWAYRESTTPPTGIKRDIRQDCLRERLQENRTVQYGYQSEKRPGDFSIGEQKFNVQALNPWILDNTQSGKINANLHFFANGGDPGKMHGLCRLVDVPLPADKANAQLRANALTQEVDLNGVSEPVVKHEAYANGFFSHITLPLRKAPNSADAALKLPRYITHGLYLKDKLRCDFRAETYLPDGPAQRSAVNSMHSVHALKP